MLLLLLAFIIHQTNFLYGQNNVPSPPNPATAPQGDNQPLLPPPSQSNSKPMDPSQQNPSQEKPLDPSQQQNLGPPSTFGQPSQPMDNNNNNNNSNDPSMKLDNLAPQSPNGSLGNSFVQSSLPLDSSTPPTLNSIDGLTKDQIDNLPATTISPQATDIGNSVSTPSQDSSNLTATGGFDVTTPNTLDVGMPMMPPVDVSNSLLTTETPSTSSDSMSNHDSINPDGVETTTAVPDIAPLTPSNSPSISANAADGATANLQIDMPMEQGQIAPVGQTLAATTESPLNLSSLPTQTDLPQPSEGIETTTTNPSTSTLAAQPPMADILIETNQPDSLPPNTATTNSPPEMPKVQSRDGKEELIKVFPFLKPVSSADLQHFHEILHSGKTKSQIEDDRQMWANGQPQNVQVLPSSNVNLILN